MLIRSWPQDAWACLSTAMIPVVGVPRAKANALATKMVPYNQIKYVPSLQISVETTSKELFDIQEGALRATAATQGLAARDSRR